MSYLISRNTGRSSTTIVSFFVILVMISILYVCEPAFAGSREDFNAAYREGDFRAAAVYLREAMDKGEIPDTEQWRLYLKALEKKSVAANTPKQQAGLTSGAWVLLGTDAILSGLAVWSVVLERNMADDYEALKSSVDNTTEANYWRLLYEKEKVSAAEEKVVFACTAAGVAVLYTLLDALWLHSTFPVSISPSGDGVKALVNNPF